MIHRVMSPKIDVVSQQLFLFHFSLSLEPKMSSFLLSPERKTSTTTATIDVTFDHGIDFNQSGFFK